MRSLGTACFISLAIISENFTLGCSDQVGIGGKAAAGSGAEGSGAAAGASSTATGGSGAIAGASSTATGGAGAIAGASSTATGGAGATDPVEDMQCHPGLYYHCHGDDDCRGQQLCLESGEQLGACVCFVPNQPVADVWDEQAGHNIEGPEVPAMVPYDDRHPGDHCPTRPDLVEGTVCEAGMSCGYGGCWWFCECYETGWECDVLLC